MNPISEENNLLLITGIIMIAICIIVVCIFLKTHLHVLKSERNNSESDIDSDIDSDDNTWLEIELEKHEDNTFELNILSDNDDLDLHIENTDLYTANKYIIGSMARFKKSNDGKTISNTNILQNAIENMQDSAKIEAAIENKTIDTAAIAESGMILRFTDGTKLTFICGSGGIYNIKMP